MRWIGLVAIVAALLVPGRVLAQATPVGSPAASPIADPDAVATGLDRIAGDALTLVPQGEPGQISAVLSAPSPSKHQDCESFLDAIRKVVGGGCPGGLMTSITATSGVSRNFPDSVLVAAA